MTIVAGIDFGTASVRVSLFHVRQGRLGSGIAPYAVLRDPADPNLAQQRHQDHLDALVRAFAQANAQAGISPMQVDALAIATTGSTIVPVDSSLKPLDDYYLWCDHRAAGEAREITTRARGVGLPALDFCGGVYSAEWGWAKLLHWLRNNPERIGRFATAVEHCDLIVAELCGITAVDDLPRSICAMGHKWMWSEALGGFPPQSFFASVDPLLGAAYPSIRGRFGTSDQIAGQLSRSWAERLGVRPGIPVPIGALDAHWDAVGAGCRLGDVVNVIGTSTCMMALSRNIHAIPGVSGVVQGSIDPNLVGIEAGLAATGDVFEAIARRANVGLAELASGLSGYRAGQTGLRRILWDNGDRSILQDPSLRGVTMGWRLGSSATDELFAAIEGSGFHTRIILDRMTEHAVPVGRLINAGGIPQRNAVLNRVYANIMDRPILVPAFDPTSLGSAIFAFVACGVFASVAEAQDALCSDYHAVEPDPEQAGAYRDLYSEFRYYYDLLSNANNRRPEPM